MQINTMMSINVYYNFIKIVSKLKLSFFSYTQLYTQPSVQFQDFSPFLNNTQVL